MSAAPTAIVNSAGAYRRRQSRYAWTARSTCWSVAPATAVELPLTDEPEETLPPADEPEGEVVELTPPDADGELALPVAGELTVLPDGELVLMPVPLVAPVLGAPDAVLLPLTDPDALGLDVVGDADGLLETETPAACIAC